MTRPHAVVIGGGFAGAAAATALTEGGVCVTLIEARPVLGGRAGSTRNALMKQDVDNGQHVFLGSYRDTRAFLKRLGVEGRLRFQPSLRIPFINRSGRRSELGPGPLPSVAGMLMGVVKFTELGWRDRMSLVWGLARARGTSPDRLEGKTVDQWLKALRQTAGARRAFWDPLCYATLNERPDRAAAGFLWAVLTEGLFQSGSARAVGYATVSLSRLWSMELGPYLERNDGRLAMRLRATGFQTTSDRVTAVTVEGHPPVPADVVILATDIKTALDLAPEAVRPVMSGLAGHEHAPIVAVNFWFDKAPFAEPFVGLLDMDLHWVYNREVLWGPTAAGQVSGVISAARDWESKNNEDLIRAALADLRRAFPGFDEAPRHAVVQWERRATPSPTPHFFKSRPGVDTPLANFFLAGDHVNEGLPPTIEAACRSGHIAAKRAMNCIHREARKDTAPC